MSILVVQVLPQGIIFGADRNITETRVASDSSGKSVTVVLGQSQRPKVLRWPNRKALVGYAGAASIGGMPTDEWLYEYIGDHLEFRSFESLAHELSDKVQKQRAIDEGQRDPEALVIHLAGFEERDSQQVPVVWYIRNPRGIKNGYYVDIRKEFLCTEEFWGYFPNIPPSEIRERLRVLAVQNKPFWFHQGLDLGTFNTLEMFLRGAFALLCEMHPAHSFPQTLREWERHLKMAILTYGAYYQAFRGPGEQYVGGGADTVRLDWPQTNAAA
jgi:hypothetical protein